MTALSVKIRLISHLSCLFGIGLLGFGERASSADEPTVNYQQQIRPIIVDHCLACHGVDAETREGNLRLDRREDALQGGESEKPAILPGKPEESELIRRITSANADEVMPPASHGAPLTPQQIALLKSWIQAGAHYEEHWAFVPPKKVSLPDNQTQNPIDQIVEKHLKERKMSLSAAEDSNILCRRIYLDLIGLPPSPAEIKAFHNDGVETTVDRLLASERFGEKWARPWLDAARYSDTNGYEKDLKRDQWAWRDWVIQSLNNDKPYDSFVIEQIAGDLLPNATQDQIIATGFLRNSMINEEGAIVPEQFRMVEMFDRLDCIGKSILGLTTQCAQCHSHKFDPLTMHDYYGMFAALNNTYEAQSWVYNSQQQAKREEVLNSIARIENEIKVARPAWEQEIREFANSLVHSNSNWEAIRFSDMNSISGLNHPTQEADLSLLMKGHTSDDVYFIGESKLENTTGLQLEVLTHPDLPFTGPGRNSVGTWGIREIEFFIQPPDSKDWQKVKLQNPTADFSEPEQKHDEGKSSSGPVAFLVDGNDATWWKADRGIGLRNQASVAVLQFENPLSAPAGTKFKIAMRMRDMVGSCRFSFTTTEKPSTTAVSYSAILAAKKPEPHRTSIDHRYLFTAWQKTIAELKPQADQIDALWKQYPNADTSILHAAERPESDKRVTHLLQRGEWDKPAEPVPPGIPVAFHPLRDTTSPPRLQFAKWLVDRESPLAARVAVNRVWQTIFGLGLVETSEDFGTRAPMPEYRDLLDWLSVDFMENQWSTKKLIRTIVTSQTYQQSSRVSPTLLELDPENRLLARGPRFRAEAEVIRDMAMAMAGIIHHEMGGPGIIPPVPQNVLDYNYVYPSYWTPAQGPQRYRRTIYNFRKRSMPDPAMSTFDAPNGDFACSRRMRSNTPLAALTALNEPIFIEAAQALGLRILREGGPDEASRIDYIYQICMARSPNTSEKQVLTNLLVAQRKRIAEGWLNPREIITGKADQLPNLPEGTNPQDAAAWTIAARVMLNLDETISKN